MEDIDLETIRGDDDGWTFEVLGSDDEKINLSEYRLDMWIKPKKGEVIKLSTDTGEIKVNENQVLVTLSHDKTQGAKWEEANWDLQYTTQEGIVRTIAGGGFSLIHDVTEV